jgi:uncharacterized protein YgfB (UPF0149 family)
MNPDFDRFCHLLAEGNIAPLAAHPAEIHGLGCGLLAAGLRPDVAQLSRQISHYVDEECSLGEAAIAYFEQSLQALESDLFEFRLCLPDDDIHDLQERLESLSAWCAGFLHGFASVQHPLGIEAQELLGDLVEISRVDASALDAASDTMEDSESDYSELTEFVRMAVISLFMDHNRPPTPARSNGGNHDDH